ncbi:MAG: radical SAM protein [Nitrospirae bacterium]|nr:MAG: radical SAM protein [Nitrospirota bacterium]
MIRKVYTDMIQRKLGQEGPSWLFKRVRQYLLLQLSEKLHRPLCGPALGTLMVTYRCNFHCAMCDMPLKAANHIRDNEKEFDTNRFINIIREFARLGVPGIGFTGGEPLLRQDIFELMAETRRLGMIAHLNSNGWLLGDEQAERIIDIGVDSVNISLDGATAKTHDRIRQTTGAFDRAVEAVERLVSLKKKHNSHVRIKTVAVIDETNIDEVPQMLTLGRTLGIDYMELIPRQPFTSAKQCTAEAALLAKADRLVKSLLNAEYQGVPLENSPAHLRLFHNSFAGLPSPIRCSAGYNSLAVDCYGYVFPCVPWINWGKTTGSIRQTTLADLWNSPDYQRHREKTGRCRDCYLNCQTELNLLFDLRGHLMQKFIN